MANSKDPYLKHFGIHNESQRMRYDKFARLYLAYGNATKAYAECYPNGNKYQSNKHCAYMLSRHPYIIYKLNQINKEIEDKMTEEIIMNRKRILEELEDILDATKGEKRYTAALKALDQISKIVGVYAPEKQEVELKGITINYIQPEENTCNGECDGECNCNK